MKTLLLVLMLGFVGCAGENTGKSIQWVLANEQIPGNYTLQDGTTLTIDGNGAITSSSFGAQIGVMHWPELNSIQIESVQGASPFTDGLTTYDHSQEPTSLTIGQTVLTKVP